MKKRVRLFLLGVVLFLSSLPLAGIMVLERMHQQNLQSRYTITNVNELDTILSFPPEVEEMSKNNAPYINPWQFKTEIKNVSFSLNGKIIHEATDVPVRSDETGMNRYYGQIAFLQLEDQQTNKTSSILITKETHDSERQLPNGDITGFIPPEQLRYILYEWDEEGNTSIQHFSFGERSSLQTALLNRAYVTPYSIGHYTDAWHMYPSLFFPFLYPFGSLVAGVIVCIGFFPRRKKHKNHL